MTSNITCLDRCRSTSIGKGFGCSLRTETAINEMNDELNESSFNINLQDLSTERVRDPNDSFDDMKIEDEIPSERQKVEGDKADIDDGAGIIVLEA